jgi:hypothetical protein
MKTLNTLSGGYRRYQDYLLTVQSELTALGNSILGSISFDVVLSGCAVTNNNDGTVSIAPGIVYINGQVMRFDGANNIIADGTKSIITGAPVTSGPVVFFDTTTKNVYTETKGVVGNTVGGNARQLVIRLTLLTFEGYIDARITASAVKGQIREFVFTDTDEIAAFKAKFDESGNGVTVDMLDWHLMNGMDGQPDAQGRTFIGEGRMTDPITGIQHIYTSGDFEGEITHKNTVNETATPPGTVNELDGPHAKPGDGGGNPEYYIKSMKSSAPATASHNNMQPYLVVFKIRKVR